MISVIQRVEKANVRVKNYIISGIDRGLLVLLGITKEDTQEDAEWLCDKIINFRIFEDVKGKMNLSLKDIRGALMVVSQFTLVGNCLKGKRPSFDNAASGEKARLLYEHFIKKAKISGLEISTGEFGQKMRVQLVNDGPVTFILDSSFKKPQISTDIVTD